MIRAEGGKVVTRRSGSEKGKEERDAGEAGWKSYQDPISA